MKLSQLKIDPEFQSKIPPLQFEEEQQLEQNIIAEGRLLNPIITWNGYILDGHTRYRILKKHGFIKFEVEEIQFANKYEALAWICKNQLGRRNLSPERKKFLLGKEYESTKLAVGGQPGNCNKVNRCDQNDHIDADMEPHIGSEQGGKRPVVVLQNNIGNRHSPTLIVATVTTRTEKKKIRCVFWRLCGRIEKTRRKETAVTLQQLRYVTAVAGTGTISHAVQQFYISQPSLTNAIRELEQEVGLALSKTASSVVSRTLLEYLRSTRQQKDAPQIK